MPLLKMDVSKLRTWTVILMLGLVYLVHGVWYSCTIMPNPVTRARRHQVLWWNERDAYNLSLLNATKDFHTLVDREDFRFLLNVHGCHHDLFLLVFVHSAPAHFVQRTVIRETWGSVETVGTSRVKLVFLVGEAGENHTVTEALRSEHQVHGDLVQGNFIDSYRNLTYKHIMGLKWVTYFCRSARYVFKADDDIFVDIVQLVHYLKESFGAISSRGLMYCFLYKTPYVKRSRRSKWYVSVSEYSDNYYPSYCSGWGVVMSPDVVFALYVESSRTPYFWVDDVHVTGILARKIGITHVELNDKTPVSEFDVQKWLDTPDLDMEQPLLFGFPNSEMDIIHRMWKKTLQYYLNAGKLAEPSATSFTTRPNRYNTDLVIDLVSNSSEAIFR